MTPSTSTIEVETVRTLEGFLRLEEDWESLLERIPGHTPFSTHAWCRSWIEAFGDRVELLLLVARQGDRTVGLAPLCDRSNGILTFIGYPQNDYADFLIDPSTPPALPVILEALLALPDRWRRIILDQFPESSQSYEALIAHLARNGHHFRRETADLSPSMQLDDLAAAKKVYYKRHIATYINGYRKLGQLSFNVCETPESTDACLESMFDQHINRWCSTATPSQFRDERFRQFYRSFTRRMQSRGWIHLCSLKLDTDFLSFFLSFEYDGKLFLYKPSYNPSYANRCPGQVILRYIFDYAAARNLKELDFCRGDEPYKLRYTNVIRQNQRAIIYRQYLSFWLASIFNDLYHSPALTHLLHNSMVGSYVRKLGRWICGRHAPF